MALINWDDEEKKKDELLDAPVKQVASIQSSSWQPAPSGADAPALTEDQTQQVQPQESYLLSEQKAQADAQKAQRDAEIEQARRQDAARQMAEANAMQAEQQAAAVPTPTPEQQAAPKYVPANPQGKKEGGFKGFIKGVGAGVQQGLGAVADVAIKGGAVVGSIGKEDQELLDYMKQVEQVRNWVANKKDITGNNLIGTRDIEDEADRISSGQGSLRDFATVGGKSLQVGIDSTMFLNPARIAAAGAKGAAPLIGAEAILKSPILKYAARDAAFFGGLQGTATFQKTYGETGDVTAALEAAAIDAGIGGAMQGSLDIAGNGLGVAANKTVNSLRRDAPNVGDDIASVVEQGTEFTPVAQERTADGVIANEPPATDSNVSFETPAVTPVGQSPNLLETPELTPVADGVPTVPEQGSGLSEFINNQADENGLRMNDASAPDVVDVNQQPIPVADGIVRPTENVPAVDANMPVVDGEKVKVLKEAIPGASQADEALINQKLQEAEVATPRIAEPNSQALPEGIAPVKAENLPEMEAPSDGSLTPAQVAERLMPKLADNSDVKGRIAEAVGMGKDKESPVRDILRDGGINPKKAERIATQFDELEKHVMEYNRLEEANQKAYAEGGTDALDSDVSKQRSRAAREMGITTRRLMSQIKRIENRDKKVALINGLSDIVGTRNASVLTSAGLLERNITQELSANLKLAAKNPIKMAKSTFTNGNILADTAKSELSHWKDAPGNPIEAVKYIVGNTYRTAMIPTTAIANTRRGAVRDELTKWAFQELEGRKVSSKEAHKLSGTAGNEMEALVNTIIGADNGMSNRGQAKQALDAWKEYIRSGDDGAKSKFMEKVEQHNSLADQMIAGLSKEDETKARGLMAMRNLIFPFVRTATNLAKTTVQQDLNPMAKSLLDEISADQRSGGANAINLIKSKLVDYGIMGGAAVLATSGILVYNDGDEVDKPRGWAVKVGDDKYIPVRATSLELPIALAGTAQAMATDISAGKARDASYYSKMVTGSLPYIDQFNTTTGAVDSLMGAGADTGDKGYAAKSYGVNTAKSFVPFSNNGVQAYAAGKQGESLNAKTSYDKNMGTWLKNTVQKSYDPDFYNGLNDSRDNAGRVRTVDNQGVVTNKKINDPNTAEFNDRITDLVNYGRENKLGKNTQDMFNTYDTGKNNNFKSIQDSITFLDVETGADGKKSPQAKDKLKKNGKLSGLSSQIREGFYGDTGSELLTLDGQELKSDASVPNKAGTKNSKLPMSMQSIKNAVAQTDIGKEQSDKLYEISNQSGELYNQLKAKTITYDEYSAAKAKLGEQEISILSGSKNYAKMVDLFDELDQSGFFKEDGLGSTKSGQTYLWNSLNALLGSKGATPAANYPEEKKGFTPYGRGGRSGSRASNKPGDRGNEGIKFTPVGKRQMAAVATGKYTPVNIKVRLGSEIKKDRSQNYADRSF